MSHIYQSVDALVGETPILALSRFSEAAGLKSPILAKLEYLNPAGSVKDRLAKALIEQAEREGKIQKGGTLIEPTSGNTGIGLASIAAARGYRLILTMPDTMSVERRRLLKAYGAEVVLTDGTKGMQGAVDKARELVGSVPGAHMPSQFENRVNPEIHEATTGPEIWKDTDGVVDVFVAGVGTGGTISGAGAFLKKQKPSIRVVAVEPEDSPVLSAGKAGPHKIQGIGAGFVPKTLDTDIYDEVVAVATEHAYNMCHKMARQEGLLIGISSGAALYAALQIALREPDAKKCVVVVFPDSGERYLSTTALYQ